MMMWKMMWMTFLKKNESRSIIWLDYCGYHLADSIQDLTIVQELFIAKGRLKLHEEMHKVKEK